MTERNCLNKESTVNVIADKNRVNRTTLNNNIIYDSTLKYNLYDGIYILKDISSGFPIALKIHQDDSKNVIYYGEYKKNRDDIVRPDKDNNAEFYYGNITIYVRKQFTNSISISGNVDTLDISHCFIYNSRCALPISNIINNNLINSTTYGVEKENNCHISYNNNLRPWKLNTSYILHNNNYINEDIKQLNDIKNFNFNHDSSNNNLVIESINSNIAFYTHSSKKIIFKSNIDFEKSVYFFNNANFSNSCRFDASKVYIHNLIIYNDSSFNNNLFVENDISCNSKLFVAHDVSCNSNLFVKDDVSFNKNLFVENDISCNSKLFVKDIIIGDISNPIVSVGSIMLFPDINNDNLNTAGWLKCDGQTTITSLNYKRLHDLYGTDFSLSIPTTKGTLNNMDFSFNYYIKI